MGLLYGGILWASVACAIPVIIHMVMRTKARPVVLPTMQFVRKSHRASISRRKIKHYILLALRILAVILLVLLIAGPSMLDRDDSSSTAAARAVVIVIDNTASMGYRFRGETLAERGRRMASNYVASLPAGSRVAIVDSSGEGGSGFLADLSLAADNVLDLSPGYGGEGLAPAIGRAVEMLDGVAFERREIVVVSDMTSVAWRGLKSMENVKGLIVRVIDPGQAGMTNVAIKEPYIADGEIPLNGETELSIGISCVNAGGNVPVRVEFDGREISRPVIQTDSDGAGNVNVRLVARRGGVLQGRVMLAGDDLLQSDNIRYFTVRAVRPRQYLLISPSATGNDDTAFLISCAVGPVSSQASGKPSVTYVRPDKLDVGSLRSKSAVIYAGGVLKEQHWGILEKYVRGGGVLWVVAGSGLSADSCNGSQAQRLMPATLKGPVRLAPSVGLTRSGGSEQLLSPFDSEENPPLSDVRCYQRFSLPSSAANSQKSLFYSDGVPAILSRSVGSGSVIFWNFSPAREWSNMGRLGGQLVILARRTARLIGAENRSESRQYSWGRKVEIPVPHLDGLTSASLQGPDGEVRHIGLGLRQRELVLDADRLGNYLITFRSDGEERVEGFSVNVPFSESDLGRIEYESLLDRFPPGSCSIASSLADLQESEESVSRSISLLPVVLLVLLLFLTAESYFSNRFFNTGNAGPFQDDSPGSDE